MPRYRNFDTLRLLAASSVIFSHSFLIAEGQSNDPFVGPFGHTLGIYGVFVFFILSGLLVTQSMISCNSIASFSLKRLLRIYPGLVVCNVLTLSFGAALFYGGPLAQFFSENGRS